MLGNWIAQRVKICIGTLGNTLAALISPNKCWDFNSSVGSCPSQPIIATLCSTYLVLQMTADFHLVFTHNRMPASMGVLKKVGLRKTGRPDKDQLPFRELVIPHTRYSRIWIVHSRNQISDFSQACVALPTARKGTSHSHSDHRICQRVWWNKRMVTLILSFQDLQSSFSLCLWLSGWCCSLSNGDLKGIEVVPYCWGCWEQTPIGSHMTENESTACPWHQKSKQTLEKMQPLIFIFIFNQPKERSSL